MKSVVRIVVIVAGVVLLLLVGLFAYLKFVFDPNDFRERIGTLVQTQTGRSFSIDGELGLSVFPWVGVEIGGARLGNAEGFSERPFARIRSAEVRALLMPLLSGRVEVDRVTLDGLELNLERNRSGADNWSDLAAAGGGAGKPDAGAAPTEAGAMPKALALGGLTLRDAVVRWHDAAAGSAYEVSALSLETGSFQSGKPMPLVLSAKLAGGDPAIRANLSMKGEVVADLAANRHRLGDLELSLDGTGEAVPGGTADIAVSATALEVDLGTGSGRIDGLQLNAFGLTAKVDAALAGLAAAPHAKGRLSIASFSPKSLATAFGIALRPSRDASVLQHASLEADFDAGASSAKVSGLGVELDQTRIEGAVAVGSYAGPAVEFDLSADAIDLDSYLPPEGTADGTGKASAGKAGRGADGPLIPTGPKVDGRFRLGRMTVSKLKLTDIDLAVALAGGRLSLKPQAALYQGRYSGNIGVDGRKAVPALTLDERLSGVQIGPLTQDLTGEAPRITGSAHIAAKLAGRGADGDALKRSLAGDVDLRFADGALKGINIAAFMRKAEAALTGKPAPADEGPNETDFTEMTATVQLADGVARNQDLAMRSPLLRVRGEGSANLVSESVDYLVQASVVGTLTGQGGKPLDKVRGVTVPIRVKGGFSDPRFSLDTQALLSDNVKAKVEEKKEEIKKKAEDKLKEEVGKGLKNLFK